MASVTRDSQGGWIIRFFAPGRRRRTVRVRSLGPRETQDSLRLKIGHLEEAAREGAEPAADVLDWLAFDLAENGYDLKRTIRWMLTSEAYQRPAVSLGENAGEEFVFAGPGVRRLTAEQMLDAFGGLAMSSDRLPELDDEALALTRHLLRPSTTEPATWDPAAGPDGGRLSRPASLTPQPAGAS